MDKRVCNLLTIASLILCLAASVFWIRGYWASCGVGWYRSHWTADHHLLLTRYTVGSCQGQFELRARYLPEDWGVLFPAEKWESRIAAEREASLQFQNEFAECAGSKFFSFRAHRLTIAEIARQSFIGYDKLVEPKGTLGGCVEFPAWLVIALTAILPLRWITKRRRNNAPRQTGGATLALAWSIFHPRMAL
jgi:hypothetical protein